MIRDEKNKKNDEASFGRNVGNDSFAGIGDGNLRKVEAASDTALKQVNEIFESTRTDFRDESIYSVMITRFYDGDTGNNVHCWDDSIAGNPDSNPAWRGDFKGLIEKLDYIKALGFTAICVTPVAQNASVYDYHGEHPINLKKIDSRYESEGYTYEDFLKACEEKGMKVLQTITINNTGSFGEENLYPIFEKLQAGGTVDEDMKPTELFLGRADLESAEAYEALGAPDQLQIRHSVLRTEKDLDNIYHHNTEMSWDDYTVQFGTLAADCVDLNTENPIVYQYLVEVFETYMDMGVDAFLIKDADKISRLTYNKALLPAIHEAAAQAEKDIEIFGEAQTRDLTPIYRETSYLSAPFYSWNIGAENYQWSDSDWEVNYQEVIKFSTENTSPSVHPTGSNGFLSGLNYHKPDDSQFSGMHMVDFPLQWSFVNTGQAFSMTKTTDKYYNDPTWNITRIDSLDYGVDTMGTTRFSMGELSWAENLNLIFTFRGIPQITYGSEVEFQKNKPLDLATNVPLSETGRAYFGDYLEGTVTTWGFGEYGAVSGRVADTLDSELALHIQTLNRLRQAIPALRKGQYTTDSNYVQGNMAFIRRYTGEGIDSLALVTLSDGATFKNIPNGRYVDAVSGEYTNVTNGTLQVSAPGKGNLAVYVCCASGFFAIEGALAPKTTYIKGTAGKAGAQDYITGSTTPTPEITDVPEPIETPDVTGPQPEYEENWVYFKKPDGWGDKINAYIWNSSSEPIHGQWPGNELTNFGNGIYGCEVPEGGKCIIFNDGINQTSDLELNAGMLYDGEKGKWLTVITPTPEITDVPKPTEEVTPTETEAPQPSVTEAPQPSVTEAPQPTITPGATEDVKTVFSDVHKDWYTDYVQYVYDNGLMTGIKGTTKFQPNANITKAQVAQVLYNMENQPEVADRAVFTDLKDVYKSEWYADAVAWAYSTGVVTGDLTTKKFNPNADVTREQLALMMFRYAQYKEYDTSATSDFAGLANAHKVASWSMDGVKWAVGAGLVSGVSKGNVKDLAPQGNATRAQVAAILQRFCKEYE